MFRIISKFGILLLPIIIVVMIPVLIVQAIIALIGFIVRGIRA